MKSRIERTTVLLKQDRLVRIAVIAGRSVIGVRGVVWLTQEGDARDVLLTAGSQFVLDRPGIALAHALSGDAVFSLDAALRTDTPAAAVPACLRDGALAAALDRIPTRYDPARLAALPIAQRNAIVQREAHRLRAEVMYLLLQRAAQSFASMLRCVAMRLSAWALATGSPHRAK